MNLQEKIEDLRKRTLSDLLSVADEKTLNNLRTVMLGKKGELTEILKGMKDLTNEERPVIGALANAFRDEFGAKFEAKKVEIEQAVMNAALESETLDVTLPGKAQKKGSRHILTQTQEEIEEIFLGMGYEIVDGYEVETDHYNFERMNLPKDHPARDMQDTYYLSNGMLLRTQTSDNQIHAMENYGAPLRICAPGRTFRNEDLDANHENTFFQIEGMVIDKGVSIENLLYVMQQVLSEVFHQQVKVRLRPGFFPFTEPSYEMDMSCLICGGKGCPTCKNSGYIEMVGSGMVHPNVLKAGGIDSEEYTGFAFGIGLTRLAMMKYKINDIRVLNSGDIRYLKQFDVD